MNPKIADGPGYVTARDRLVVMKMEIDAAQLAEGQRSLRNKEIEELDVFSPDNAGAIRNAQVDAIQDNPARCIYAICAIGNREFQVGRFDRAAAYFKKAIGLCTVELNMLDKRSEKGAGERRIVLGEMCADIYNDLGSMQLRDRSYGDAESSFDAADKYYKKYAKGTPLPYAADNLAAMYWKLGKYGHAKHLWEDVRRRYAATLKRAEDELWINHLVSYGDLLAFCFTTTKDATAKAIKVYTRASELKPDGFSSRLGLMAIYDEYTRDHDRNYTRHHLRADELGREAVERLMKYLGTTYDLEALVELGSTLAAIDLHELAEEVLYAAHEINEENRIKYNIVASPKPLTSLGVLLVRHGHRYDEAVECFRHALIYDPEDSVLRSNLAEVYLRLGRLDEAEREFRSILRQAPQHIESLIGLAETCITRAEAGDDEYFHTAVGYYTAAWKLVSQTTGSKRLNRIERAALLYARGYARTKYATTANQVDAISVLQQAGADFKRAFKYDRNLFQAEHAVRKIGNLFKNRGVPKVLEQVVPVLVAMGGAALFVLAQVWAQVPPSGSKAETPAFIFGGTQYIAVTFGGLAMLIVGAYLPKILRLKVAGIELEKGMTDQIETVRILEISRRNFITDSSPI